MIWSVSMEGSRLRYGPSVILSLSVEGSNTDTRTVRDMCLYRGWLSLFTSNCPRNRPLAWKVRAWILNHPRYGALTWKVRSWRMEPSAILSLSVEGSTPGSRTIRDMCLYRGRLASLTSNCPRNRPLAWKVRVWMLNHP